MNLSPLTDWARRYHATRLMVKSRFAAGIHAGQFEQAMRDAINNYINTPGASISSVGATMRSELSDKIMLTARAGWSAGGGENFERGPNVQAQAAIDFQISLLATFLDWLRSARDILRTGTLEERQDIRAEISRRIGFWTRSISAQFNEFMNLAAGRARDLMATWIRGATEVGCQTCISLDGQRHTQQWFSDREFFPRKPGAAMVCRGFNCDCRLVDDEGFTVTL